MHFAVMASSKEDMDQGWGKGPSCFSKVLLCVAPNEEEEGKRYSFGRR